jgi:protein-disulfide isomerase
MGVDINAPDLSVNAVVATVGGQPLTASALNERLKPILYRLRAGAYEIQREAAEKTVDDLLLLAEAGKRNIGPEEIVRSEVSEKIHTPTEAEVVKFYAENRDHIPGDLELVRHQVALYLQEEDRRRLERALSERLRKGVNIQWLISEPAPPVQSVSADDDPVRGPANAPVTVIEFTDFQCPACAAMQPVLDEVLKPYGDKVRFVVRDFPLAMHPNARKAAEAANAAHAQGKFFEYTALLFKRQNALDVDSLKKYATELGLNRARFDAALDGGKYAAEIRRDIQDGEVYGIDSTPAIFINGVRLFELSPEALRGAIDRTLAAQKPSASSGKQ